MKMPVKDFLQNLGEDSSNMDSVPLCSHSPSVRAPRGRTRLWLKWSPDDKTTTIY